MRSLFHSCATIIAIWGSCALASDQDVLPTGKDSIEVYRNAAGWTVFKNHTRQSCFFSRSGKGKSIIQMGVTKNQEFGYVGAFVKDAGLESGAKDIAVIVNGNVYRGEPSSVAGGYRGGYILVNNFAFINDIKASRELIAFPNSPHAVKLSLRGAESALHETRECMRELQRGY